MTKEKKMTRKISNKELEALTNVNAKTSDLIKKYDFGKHTWMRLRKLGKGPQYFELTEHRGIRYRMIDVIEWVESLRRPTADQDNPLIEK